MGIFLDDLEIGEGVEREVCARLEPYFGPLGWLPILKEREKGYDIKMGHPSKRQLLFEVKFDRASWATNNIAIEFQCSGKWSGIATSIADFWVFKYFDHGDWHFRCVTRQQLQDEWRSRRYPAVYGGDDMRARMILVPVRALATWGVKL